MTRILSAILVSGLAVGAAIADPVTIAVGQTGRGYEARGLEIAQRLEQRGHEVVVENHEGSDAISLAVCDDRATVGIMQIDAIYARAKENCMLKPIGSYGDEFAFILFPPDSRNNELDDLGEGDKILVDTIGSGTELFWRNIVAIETGDQGNKSRWSKATPVYDLTLLADTMAKSGEIDALIMVGLPQNNEVMGLLEGGWTLGELYDKDINDERFGDGSLYKVRTVEIEVPGRWRNLRNDAYVVPSFIAITEATANGDRKLYGDIVAAAQ
ncbi:MAG: hypothetical protein AAGF94_11970 [Pseudomonadota bacterium]